MKTPLLILMVCLSAVSAFAQPTRTLKLTQLEESPDTSAIRDGYTGVTDTNGRQRYTNFPRINLTCLTYTPPATGNIPFYYSTFVVKCSTDSTWYIDWTGRAFFLAYIGTPPLVPGSTLSISGDTLCLTGPSGGNCVLLPTSVGSVTSVGLVAPTGVFDVSGSPVTGAGNLTLDFDTQSANTFFAGPTSGGAATPAFRALVAADVPLNFIDSTHIKSKGVAFTNLAPTAGITINQAPLWNTTLSKFVAKTVLTTETMGSNNLSGLLTSPTVVAIQDVSVAATTPTNGQVLAYNSAAFEYQPTTLSTSGSAGGDLTGTYPNPTIGTDKVDSTKVGNGKLSLDDLNQRGAVSGQAIVWNGSAWRPTTVPAAANVQEFIADGTWTKPSGAKWVEVICIGGGGGGGSGRRSSGGGTASGGGGGGGGGRSLYTYDASDLSATVTVTVGTGGTGGTGTTAANANGNAGTAGGNSTFGAYLKAVGGGAGAAGNGSGSSNGGAAGGGLLSSGGTGGTGTQATFGAGAVGNYASAGGGSGGAGGSVVSAGGAGGAAAAFYGSTIAAGTAGSSGGGVGGNGNSDTATMLGSGGGGGGGNSGASAGAGGNGGSFGSGGGGGGGVGSGTTSGAGGAGSNGIVVVITYF